MQDLGHTEGNTRSQHALVESQLDWEALGISRWYTLLCGILSRATTTTKQGN